MSSTTTRVSLYKPAGGENVNVTTDLNNNLDKLDTNLSFRVAASQTARNAISPFWEGLNVRDTDTGKCWVSNGSAPISASWDQIATANTKISNISLSASAGSVVIRSEGTGNTFAPFYMLTDGSMRWGSGTGAIDTTLYRSAADTLKTDDNFIAGGTGLVTGDLTTGGNVIFTTGGTAEIHALPSTSTTISNTLSESVVATYAIPASDAIAGAVYKITAWGTINTTTGTNNLNLRARLGGVAGTQLAQTGNMVQQASMSVKVWKAEAYVVCLTTGGSATWFSNLLVHNGATVAGGNPVITPGTYMDGGVITLDSTVSQSFVLTVTWTVASASNSFVCRGFSATREA